MTKVTNEKIFFNFHFIVPSFFFGPIKLNMTRETKLNLVQDPKGQRGRKTINFSAAPIQYTIYNNHYFIQPIRGSP